MYGGEGVGKLEFRIIAGAEFAKTGGRSRPSLCTSFSKPSRAKLPEAPRLVPGLHPLRLSSVEEHRSLLSTESCKSSALEETRLARDREEFLYSTGAGPLFAKFDQLRSDSTFLEIGMYRQTAHFRQPFGINLESATADDPRS